MSQLELSIIHWGGTLLTTETITDVIESFDIPCQLTTMTGIASWEELVRIALYRFGADVSQVGSTWLGDLVVTGAVRPFTGQEIDEMGGPSAFVPALWQTACPHLGDQAEPWGIPWHADTRVIFYWRDILEQAGVDEQTAFETPERVEETMARLRASKSEAPWGIWTPGHAVTLQNAASWVWAAGGDFVSVDGKQILFNQPAAVKGLLAYLDLIRNSTPPDIRQIDAADILDPFTERRVAVTMGPVGWLGTIYEQCTIPDVADRLGMATPPGPVFVGGSHLIVWRHTRREQDAIALVRFLTSKQAAVKITGRIHIIPARLDALEEPPFTAEPHHQVVTKALMTGRSYPMLSKWGAVEYTLSKALVWFWNSILADRDQDLESLVKPYLDSLAQRLTVTLGIRE